MIKTKFPLITLLLTFYDKKSPKTEALTIKYADLLNFRQNGIYNTI